MTTRIFIGVLVFLFIAILVIVIASGESERMEAFDESVQGRSIENGAELFQGNCDRCHGIQGQGIAGVAPPLNSYDFFTNRLQEVGYSGSLRSYIDSTITWPELRVSASSSILDRITILKQQMSSMSLSSTYSFKKDSAITYDKINITREHGWAPLVSFRGTLKRWPINTGYRHDYTHGLTESRDRVALDREYFFALHPRRTIKELVRRIRAALGVEA